MKKVDPFKGLEGKDQPRPENYPVLMDWLEKHNARCNDQIVIGQNAIEIWVVNGRLIMILLFPNKKGWDIYTALDTNVIADTLRDAESRVKL